MRRLNNVCRAVVTTTPVGLLWLHRASMRLIRMERAVFGWQPANPGNMNMSPCDCASSQQCLLGCCHNNICWAVISTMSVGLSLQRQLLGLRIIAFRDLLCHDQGLFPSLGPSSIDPHTGCGPRSIGLVVLRRRTSCAPASCFDVAPFGRWLLWPRWLKHKWV